MHCILCQNWLTWEESLRASHGAAVVCTSCRERERQRFLTEEYYVTPCSGLDVGQYERTVDGWVRVERTLDQRG